MVRAPRRWTLRNRRNDPGAPLAADEHRVHPDADMAALVGAVVQTALDDLDAGYGNRNGHWPQSNNHYWRAQSYLWFFHGQPTGFERFVARHRDWAERRSKELLQLAPKAAERQPQAVEIRLLDRLWSVEYVPGRRVRTEQVGDSMLRVHAPAVTDRYASQALVPWLTRLASHELSHRLRPLATEVGIEELHLAHEGLTRR